MTTNVPNLTPWLMLNFSTSRKMCLVSILGWIWAMQCLDRERRGNLLWKHTEPYTVSFYSLKCYLYRFPHIHTCYILAYFFDTEVGVAPGVQKYDQLLFQLTVTCDKRLCQRELTLQDQRHTHLGKKKNQEDDVQKVGQRCKDGQF